MTSSPNARLTATATLRAFFALAGVVAALAAVHSLMVLSALAPAHRLLLSGLFLLISAVSLLALKLPVARAQRVMLPVILTALVAIGAIAVATGWGLRAPGLYFFGVICCMTFAVGRQRHGMVVTLVALGLVLVLAAAEWQGVVPQSLEPGVAPLVSRMLMQLAAIATGAGAGLILSHLSWAYVRDASEREERFRDLLGIAAAAYWETDDCLRITHVSRRNARAEFMPMTITTPKAPWDIVRLTFDDEVLDRLRAEMEAREPLRDVPLRFCGRNRPDQDMLASGEPRVDSNGRFRGYWGVARDVTSEHRARAAHERSEALLRQVVSTSPDVITLTDMGSGRYEMVNDSFTRLTGYGRDEVLGRTALEIGIWTHSDDRDRMLARLRSNDTIKDLAVSFVHRSGHRLPMLVSASRFEREGRQYLVVNARDTSEANRERLEREAIMANASVGIAHTRGQRIVTINPQLEQMYGWPPGELVGQSTRVLWPSDDDHDSLGRQIGPALRRGESVDLERLAKRHDGSSFLVRLRASAIDPRSPATGGTIWVAEDVTAQRQAAAELARARDAAEAANRAKSAFLANTSHEIRTPLNGLVGLARMARAPDVPPQRLKQYLDQIGDSAESLSMIISDILDLSKIEAGRLQVDNAPFDLLGLLHTLHRAYASLAAGRGLGFEMQIDPRVPELVLGDALRVRQVLVNFLHNALKFTAEGRVDLHVEPVGADTLRFEVMDTGPGIDAATQARLFKPFTQADESITRRYGGTGLGLSICRELAILMGGKVGVSSAVGQGSCFYAELPLPAVDADDPASGFGAFDSELLQGCRVLMVEDNAVNMMIGVALLQQWGIQVSEAENGSQALLAIDDAAAAGRHIHAVLMDVQMPGMSGFEVTRRLRERWSARQLPVIALTAAALVSEREEALAAGMNDFVTKPVDPDRLRRALLRALSAELD